MSSVHWHHLPKWAHQFSTKEPLNLWNLSPKNTVLYSTDNGLWNRKSHCFTIKLKLNKKHTLDVCNADVILSHYDINTYCCLVNNSDIEKLHKISCQKCASALIRHEGMWRTRPIWADRSSPLPVECDIQPLPVQDLEEELQRKINMY